MSDRFVIRHPDGRRYKMRSIEKFKELYESEGFVIVGPPSAPQQEPEQVDTDSGTDSGSDEVNEPEDPAGDELDDISDDLEDEESE